MCVVIISLDTIMDFNFLADEMSAIEREAYNNMLEYSLEEEVLHYMELGYTFLEACQEWDLI